MKHISSTYNVPTLDISAKVEDLMLLLDSHDINDVPILEGSVYVGLISRKVVETLDRNLDLVGIRHLFQVVYLEEDYTLFDWLKLNADFSIKFIPIVENSNLIYKTSINIYDISRKFKNTGLIVDFSSILVLRKITEDFKYSEVFQIAEANGAKIFGSYIEQSSEEFTDIVLNINHTGLNELLQSYRRYDYDVISYHEEDKHQETLKANSDYFSKYLTV
jgi:CBS domain-containing protein